jgi:hypothetical protein
LTHSERIGPPKPGAGADRRAQERRGAGGGVLIAGGVQQERGGAGRRVVDADGVVLERGRAGPEHLEVRYNGEWLAKLTTMDMIKLLSRKTVALLLSREDFHRDPQLADGRGTLEHAAVPSSKHGDSDVLERVS